MRILRRVLIGLGGLAILVTLLPLLPSDAAAIRIWDFPRLQILALLVAVLATLPVLGVLRDRRAWLFAAALAGASTWQAHAIWPYTPFAAVEAPLAVKCDPDARVALLVANVLIDNRDAAPLLDLVAAADPDMILLVETDAWWDRQLQPLARTYPFVLAHPRADGHGIHLFSRFALIDPQLRFLVEEDVPSIRTGLRLPSGDRIDLHGLHPKPPPIQDTAERDAELLIVAREVRAAATPTIVAGDLNDVAWSRTNRLFQEISGLLDPRIGRGPYPTFNADWPLLRWPLDHVFFADSFRLLEVAVKPDIGSDHFPFHVALCHDPQAQAGQEAPLADAEDLQEASEAIRDGLDAAQD